MNLCSLDCLITQMAIGAHEASTMVGNFSYLHQTTVTPDINYLKDITMLTIFVEKKKKKENISSEIDCETLQAETSRCNFFLPNFNSVTSHSECSMEIVDSISLLY